MEIWNLVEAILGKEEVAGLVPGRLLAVDDDGGNLVVLEELLMDRYDITCTTSPAEALKLARETEFDMVISDQRMPEITGVELLHQVRELHPNTVRVIISAYSDAKAMLQAINVGEVYRFILKPWDPDEIEATVQQGLEYRLSILVIQRLVDALHKRNRELGATLTELRDTQDKLLHSARLATVGQLTASIVRELKNHVTGVRILAEAIEEAEVPDELTEYVRVGANSAQSLFDLISGLNAFSGKGGWRLRRRKCSLARLLEEALSIVRLDSRSKRLEINLVHGSEVREIVVDAEKIRQVAVNLVLNALDATPPGGRIEISTSCHQDGWVLLEVRDTGAGIPEEMRARVMDPFVSTKKEGLGLGLQVCRKVVEAHGGRLDIHSDEGKGTVVMITLPAEPGLSLEEE